jgi:hypothetical protein
MAVLRFTPSRSHCIFFSIPTAVDGGLPVMVRERGGLPTDHGERGVLPVLLG